jgi:hypothetical protein
MATASKLGRNKVSSERDITAAPECKYFSIACVPNENQKVIGLDENNFDSVIHLRPCAFVARGLAPVGSRSDPYTFSS